ncbi:MAG: polysaccharide deacetylase family protein [Oscillospiraceae bacterium]|nr:polysaccharide deacetylase family protein [Oscillospiraceae bacterium]
MKSRKIFICALAIVVSCLVLSGCMPNVNNDGAAGTGTTPLVTTPRTVTTTPPPNHTTPRTQTDEAAVGEIPSAANPFIMKELMSNSILMEFGDAAVCELRALSQQRNPYYPINRCLSDNSISTFLSDTKIGWGLGRAVDERNRPVDALAAQSKYGHLGAVFIDDKTENKIFLTFDEGYENGYTPLILDTLKEKGVRATFFVTYDYCKDRPELVRRMIDEGHEVANHSYSHPSFPHLSDERVREEVMKLHDYVKDNFNYEMRLIRFPMGEFSERVLALTQELGYKSVFWSFAYVDWDVNNQPESDEAFRKITAAAHPGAVVLLHAVSGTNAEILAGVIGYWEENGFELGLIE